MKDYVYGLNPSKDHGGAVALGRFFPFPSLFTDAL